MEVWWTCASAKLVATVAGAREMRFDSAPVEQRAFISKQRFALRCGVEASAEVIS